MGQWINDLAAGSRTFADRLADRQDETIPSEDPAYSDLGQAFPAWSGPSGPRSCSIPARDGRPRESHSAPCMDRDADREAAD